MPSQPLRAERVHFAATRRFDTELVYEVATPQRKAEAVYAVAQRSLRAREVYNIGVPRLGATPVFVVGSEAGDDEAPVPTYHLTFDGVDDKIVVPASASLDSLPLGDFTVEWAGRALGNNKLIVGKTNLTNAGWGAYVYNGPRLYFSVIYDGWDSEGGADYPPISDEVHHICGVYTAATHSWKVFVDGVEAEVMNEYIYGSFEPYDDLSFDLTVMGAEGAGSNPSGDLNWLRISNIARHASNFAPPSLTVAPADDANTVLLLALDAGVGTVAADTSGNGNDGAITGATWMTD